VPLVKYSNAIILRRVMMSAISALQNRILVTDDANRNFAIPQELESAFYDWRDAFGEEFEDDHDEEFAEYLCASEGELNDSTPPAIEATFSLNSVQGRCYLIPRAEKDAFKLYVTAVENEELEQYINDGGKTFDKYTGEGARALIRSWFIKRPVN
jgi:hypothetical protein